MHDREFEKQVQQKMQELRFQPGAEVWARVQDDIRKRKRRRPVLLWILFAGLLIGSAWILYSNNRGTTEKAATVVSPGSATPVDKNHSIDNKDIPGNSGETIVTLPADNVTNKEKNVTKPSATAEQISNAAQRTNTVAITRQKQAAEKPAGHNKNDRQPVQSMIVKNDPPQAPATQKQDVATADTANTDPSIAKKDVTPPVQQPVENIDSVKAVDNAAISPKDSAEANKPEGNALATPVNNSAKRSQWNWGISAGGGISDLGKQLFQGTSVADLAYMGAGPPPPGNARRPSAVKTGAAFNLGGYVSKNISNKLRLKLGLNYEYYSNTIRIGSYVDSSKYVNQGATMNKVDEYYEAGNSNSYTNGYHFVSVPLSLQWRLNNNRRYGLVWENGISLARMLGSNALHFDGITGTYYKDNNVIQKTQWMFGSSLLFNLKTKNNLQLYIGPHIQYGFSNLVSNDANSDKHIRYAGLRMMIEFSKK